MNVLPKDYEMPAGAGNYLKLEEGDNVIRILSNVVVGWEYWVDDSEGKRKPIRVKTYDELPAEVKKWEGMKRPKHFWAMVIWNRKAESVQVYEVTQRSIMVSLKALFEDEDWGNPNGYDIKVVKEKTGAEAKDVNYHVNPKPHKPLEKEIAQEFMEKKVNLEALFTGDDPFEDEGLSSEDEEFIEGLEKENEKAKK
jgi:hypothetical protein